MIDILGLVAIGVIAFVATVDEEGDPNIQPVWFYYDKERKKL